MCASGQSVTLGVVGTKLVSSCGSLLPIFKPEKPEVASMLVLLTSMEFEVQTF